MIENKIYCHDILGYMNEIAPFLSAESFDNVGLMVGREWAETKRALVALDCTEKTIQKAKEIGADLIITHHPLIFSPIKSLREEAFGQNRLIFELIKNDIAVISSHTCLDTAKGGVADSLAKALRLSSVKEFALSEKSGRFGEALFFGRYGLLPHEMDFEELCLFVKDALGASGIRASNQKGKSFRSLACLGGSGGSFLNEAFLLNKEGKADCFVTSDVKHDQWISAQEAGITLIDAGHFETERVVINPLTKALQERFEEVSFVSFFEETSPYVYK